MKILPTENNNPGWVHKKFLVEDFGALFLFLLFQSLLLQPLLAPSETISYQTLCTKERKKLSWILTGIAQSFRDRASQFFIPPGPASFICDATILIYMVFQIMRAWATIMKCNVKLLTSNLIFCSVATLKNIGRYGPTASHTYMWHDLKVWNE